MKDKFQGILDAVIYFVDHGIAADDLLSYGTGEWTWPMFFDHVARAYKYKKEEEEKE